MSEPKKDPAAIAIRRKSDGVFLYTRRGVMAESATPKFISTPDRAMMSVRIDMGIPLSDVDFVTRHALQSEATHVS